MRPRYEYGCVAIPRNTRNSRDTYVAVAPASPEASGPRRSGRPPATINFEDGDTIDTGSIAEKERRQPRKKGPTKKLDPKIAKELEAEVVKEEKALEATLRKREHLEWLKKQKAQEEATIRAARIASQLEKEAQQRQEKDEREA